MLLVASKPDDVRADLDELLEPTNDAIAGTDFPTEGGVDLVGEPDAAADLKLRQRCES